MQGHINIINVQIFHHKEQILLIYLNILDETLRDLILILKHNKLFQSWCDNKKIIIINYYIS